MFLFTKKSPSRPSSVIENNKDEICDGCRPADHNIAQAAESKKLEGDPLKTFVTEEETTVRSLSKIYFCDHNNILRT
jgi:hypothetical protein